LRASYGLGTEGNLPDFSKIVTRDFSNYCIWLLFKVFPSNFCPTYVYDLPDFSLTGGQLPPPLPAPYAYDINDCETMLADEESSLELINVACPHHLLN
jgi:hypothetical protein